MKKILIFILWFAATTAMFSSFFNSCEKDDCLNADGSADELTIEGSLFDPKTMSSNDLSAIAEALNRMDMHFADGRFETNNLSAKQLGISDYLYFQLQVKIAETKLLSKDLEKGQNALAKAYQIQRKNPILSKTLQNAFQY